MANYVLSPEGNKVFNADVGSFPVYDLSSLPKGYEAPPPVNAALKVGEVNTPVTRWRWAMR